MALRDLSTYGLPAIRLMDELIDGLALRCRIDVIKLENNGISQAAISAWVR
jgi:hypothetical protein